VQVKQALTIQELTVQYQGKTALAIDNITIPAGKITGIIGPNGAGKSTFIKGLLGLVPTQKRKITLGKTPIDNHRRQIAYVEQRSALDLTFPITVLEVVLMGTYPNMGLFKRPKKQERQQALAALEQVSMSAFANRQIGELSGGQLQRIFIARVLAQKAEVIILDEPFVGIDMTSEQVIISLLKQLKAAGKLILIVHHDLHKVSHYFDDLLILKQRLIAAGPVQSAFTKSAIDAAYGDLLGDLLGKEFSK